MGCLTCCFSIFIQLLGWVGLVRVVFELYNFVFYTFLSKKRADLAAIYGQGSYVVVTGSTDGIGLGYAKLFAESGFNLVCISRSAEKLKEKEKEIRAHASSRKELKIVNLAKDFSESYKPEFYADIFSAVEKLDVSILVNNVGLGTNDNKEISPNSFKTLIDTVVINCCS